MKKFLSLAILCSALGAISQAHASWYPNWKPSWEGNFMLGASVGYGERLDNVDLTLVYTSPFATIPTSFIIEDYTDNGYFSGIFAGYQFRYKRFQIGAEINVDWDNLQDTHYYSFSDANAQTLLPGFAYNAMARYERGTTVGISARIGYEITRCFMPYFRLGVEQSHDQLTAAFAGDPAIYNFGVVMQGRSLQRRYVIGIGTEIPLPLVPFIAGRFEYDYHSRGRNVEALGIINDGIGFNE